MRLRQSAAIARMLLLFFWRRVLTSGVLRSVPVRIAILTSALVFGAVLTSAAYLFLRDLTDRRGVWDLLFDTTTVSVLLWVQIAFLAVKVLFINAEGMLALTYQLPVTNRERSLAFLMYEAAMVAVLTGAGVFALTVSALLLQGPAALAPLAFSVVLPAVIAYLLLSVIHQLLARLWTAVRLDRIGGILSILVIFGLIVAYASATTPMVATITGAYLDDEVAGTPATVIARTAGEQGHLLVLVLVLVLAAGLAALTVVLSPDRYVAQARYLRIAASRRWSWLAPYDLSLLRSSHTVLSGVLTVAVFGYLLLSRALSDGELSPLWSICLLTVGGLYQFSSTAVLRAVPGAEVPAWRIFWRLLRAQLVVILAFAVPLGLVTSVADLGWGAGAWQPLLAAAAGAVVTASIGVIFPAEKDNPLSVFIGLASFATAAGLIAIGLGILRLPLTVVVMIFVLATVLFAVYAIHFIHLAESGKRHEKGTLGHQLRRRRRGGDARDRSGGDLDADVLG
ncbi:hypothetical protein ACNHYB_10340 [Isoptericola jiangsuensis]|uniref:hypothetical protein n=1 Tax=Isoptericola jiangsuensis TaxID=548579 RepID=UPI003AAA3928